MLWQDVRVALRSIRRRARVSAVIVVTLGLGIGAVTALFGVVDAALLRPLPFREPERLVVVWATSQNGTVERQPTSFGDFEAWRDRTASFEAMALWRASAYNLGDRDGARQVRGARVSPAMLATLGVRPVLGRDFEPGDAVEGAEPVALVGDGLWRSHFGGDPGAVGRALELDGVAYRVVGGVLPREVRFPDREIELWVPLVQQKSEMARSFRAFRVVARLAPGATIEQARAEMSTLAAALEGEERVDAGWGAKGTADCLGTPLVGEAGGQGEGWSDFIACSMTDDDSVGEYVTGEFDTGIRRIPYTNYRWSYGSLNGNGLNRRDQGAPDPDPGSVAFEVHDVGEVFAAMLWDMRELMIMKDPNGVFFDGTRRLGTVALPTNAEFYIGPRKVRSKDLKHPIDYRPEFNTTVLGATVSGGPDASGRHRSARGATNPSAQHQGRRTHYSSGPVDCGDSGEWPSKWRAGYSSSQWRSTGRHAGLARAATRSMQSFDRRHTRLHTSRRRRTHRR